jgi:hypothetical protein
MVDTHLPPQTIRDDHPANTKGNEMKDSEADIAINTLNKLIAQEYEAASAGMCYGNRSLEESASIRYHAYLNARDKIREALAACMP